MEKQVLAAKLNEQLKGFTPEKVLWYFIKEYGKNMAFSSSLGAEDQVLTNMICEIDKNTRIFTLDTGRMFPETYKLIEKTNSRYKIKIEIFFPDYQQVENMVHEKGINLFYESIDNRKQCCHIRKIEPLKRAFKGLDVWICGLRREQSITRTSNQLVEWDENNSLLKINPLIDWTENQRIYYIRKHNIPYNDLHDKGFPSIGCQPCTRAIKSGEDVRAGRWWWENPDKKECGLHNTAE